MESIRLITTGIAAIIIIITHIGLIAGIIRTIGITTITALIRGSPLVAGLRESAADRYEGSQRASCQRK